MRYMNVEKKHEVGEGRMDYHENSVLMAEDRKIAGNWKGGLHLRRHQSKVSFQPATWNKKRTAFLKTVLFDYSVIQITSFRPCRLREALQELLFLQRFQRLRPPWSGADQRLK